MATVKFTNSSPMIWASPGLDDVDALRQVLEGRQGVDFVTGRTERHTIEVCLDGDTAALVYSVAPGSALLRS